MVSSQGNNSDSGNEDDWEEDDDDSMVTQTSGCDDGEEQQQQQVKVKSEPGGSETTLSGTNSRCEGDDVDDGECSLCGMEKDAVGAVAGNSNSKAPQKDSKSAANDCGSDAKRSSEEKGGSCKSGKITRNPFFNFLRVFRTKHCDWDIIKIAVEGARIWVKMPDSEKLKYVTMACHAPPFRHSHLYKCYSSHRKQSRHRSRHRSGHSKSRSPSSHKEHRSSGHRSRRHRKHTSASSMCPSKSRSRSRSRSDSNHNLHRSESYGSKRDKKHRRSKARFSQGCEPKKRSKKVRQVIDALKKYAKKSYRRKQKEREARKEIRSGQQPCGPCGGTRSQKHKSRARSKSRSSHKKSRPC